ncbi:MAG: hypothetical protein QOD75_125 [Blastocatellia bacterium]|nr:hypothetical protein [Blastocatellia bacterium]
MKRLLFLAFLITFLSCQTLAQTPSPAVSNPSPTEDQASPLATPIPVLARNGIPNLTLYGGDVSQRRNDSERARRVCDCVAKSS